MPLLPLYALLRSFVARSALVPLQSVALPETVLSVDFLLLCHIKQIVIQPPVLGTRTVYSLSVGETFSITVVAERCPSVEGHSVH